MANNDLNVYIIALYGAQPISSMVPGIGRCYKKYNRHWPALVRYVTMQRKNV